MNHDTTKVLEEERKKKNYFLEVLAGLAAQKRQHSLLNSEKLMIRSSHLTN
jgi:uracil DNA glycosylase